MNPTSKLGLLTGFCWLLVSCSEFSFVPQQTASSETENPETLPTESTSGQTQTSDASETAAAEVQTIPVAPGKPG